jgi:hypothetical protein
MNGIVNDGIHQAETQQHPMVCMAFLPARNTRFFDMNSTSPSGFHFGESFRSSMLAFIYNHIQHTTFLDLKAAFSDSMITSRVAAKSRNGAFMKRDRARRSRL